jgi:endo-1,4-beta-xylanase
MKTVSRTWKRLLPSMAIASLLVGCAASGAPDATAAAGAANATITSNQTGTDGGMFYSFWTNGSGSVSMTLDGSNGYGVQWSNVGDFTCGKGWNPGSNHTITYSGSYTNSGGGAFGIYGWTTNPLVEYYIVEAPGNSGSPGQGTQVGTVTSDGGTYTIWKHQQVNQPCITGNSCTFWQYISVRQTPRTSGTITIQNHFAAWAAQGMNLGSHNYQILLTESWNGSGSASAKISEGGSSATCSAVPSAPTGLTATATSSSQINLSWGAVTPPSNCSVTYSVFRNGAQVATGLTTTSYSNTGLSAATAYQFYVRAVDSAGSSANSTTVSATTQGTGTSYALTVTKSGSGSGTVTSSAGGINCGATCSASLASGTAVTLTASAAAGSTFGGWSGACTGTGTCIVTMTAAQSVSAAFTGTTATGNVSINAGGSATGSFVADTAFSGGTTYTNTATIDTTQITGTVPPAAIFQSERYGNFTYTITGLTAGSAQTVTLYFAETYWTAAGQRSFNVSINGTAALTAFDIFAAAGGANKAIARTFNTTASSSGQVVITFANGSVDNAKVCGLSVAAGGDGGPTTYALTVTKGGTGGGTVTSDTGGINCGSTCSGSYASGTTVTLTAAADASSTFAGWSGACTGTAATCTVSMTAAQTATATFNSSGSTGTCKAVSGGQSGNFNTTGAICFTVTGTINGWGCSNIDGRTVSVNGTATTCGKLPVPGSSPYTFSFTAGSYTWASFYWW